jgi:probable HAF family extracellular repeat protein
MTTYFYTTIDDPSAFAGTTFAQGINGNGQIVGYFSDATGIHGFVDTGGVFTSFDNPFGVGSTYAYGINNNGQIVGYYVDAGGARHGYLYSSGSFTTIDDPSPTTVATQAWGINNNGEIVGFMMTPAVLTVSSITAAASPISMIRRLLLAAPSPQV